ncbi:MAG: radical SAM protein [Spirochaetota bacterium]|nr:radical SAM protein [Spirochaetota bacterium]
MLSVILKIPYYFLFRHIGWPAKLPMSLTLSVSYKCNSRCKTCNIYKKRANELTFHEWEKFFQNYGKDLFWVTISGGEPFIRKDLKEIVCSLYDNCRPSIINIPTNGLLYDEIAETVRQIAIHCSESQIVINLSIDDIEEKHDFIRGITGSYEKAIKTFQRLKAIDLPNLSVGIHTVISRFNVNRIPEIYTAIRKLNPDSYITEIAEERVELGTIGSGISPEYEEYAKAIDFLTEKMKKDNFNSVGRITRAFRMEYYQMVKKIIKKQKQIIPCYSGFASAQIAPDGDVWMCCIKADSIGNLRDANYDFKKIWFMDNAKKMRTSIKKGECYCPLANAGYTNMLHNYKSLIKATWNLVIMG